MTKPTPEQIEADEIKRLRFELIDAVGEVYRLRKQVAELTAAAEPQPDNPAYVSERAMRVATDAERERCARVADEYANDGMGSPVARAIAAAIRALKEKP